MWKCQRNVRKLEKLYGEKKTEVEKKPFENLSSNLSMSHSMALGEPKVSSSNCYSNSYSFDELQNAYDELNMEFEAMCLRHNKMISNLKVENKFYKG